MFTQNARQALRSVFVALLIGCICPTWSIAQESKVDAEVRTALQTQSTVSVAIYLRDKPPSRQISDAVKAEFYPNINAKSDEIRKRIRPFHQHNQALPANVKAEVREMHESLDRQTGQMRREIGRRLDNYVAPSQQRVRTVIENAGGTVYAQLALGNIIGAQLSATGVTRVAASEDVERIELDPVVVPALAHSAPIIYAPRFWDAGYDGGIYDVGIVEISGVEDEHRYLRSKAAGKLIERYPDDSAEPAGDHGTKVAGVVAMTADENATVKHKGIAYGLDTILDATVLLTDDTERPWTAAVNAAKWAMTYEPEDADDESEDADDESEDVDDPSADVVNISLGVVRKNRGKKDYTMDKDDPDYLYGPRIDQSIACYDVLIIQAAGNASKKGDKDKYTLAWGAGSYNAIVVGASTGGTADEPRAENKVRSASSRGPTPAGRKKPDVVAPGTDITTTIRGGGFGSITGTSAAAPHVAGAILLFADYGLSHPMMQKALLINSAEDRGPIGWDKDWGWGYIDLSTALEQIDYTLLDSIDGTTTKETGRPAVKWYKGTMSGCQTATLVWHKHDGVPLANLDMHIYRHVTDEKPIASSNSIRDNVEQVKMPEGQEGTVYIQIHYNVNYDYPETFGLALPSKFRPITPESP